MLVNGGQQYTGSYFFKIDYWMDEQAKLNFKHFLENFKVFPLK